MEMFSKRAISMPGTNFQVQLGVRGHTVFFESEPIDLSTYPACRRHGIRRRHDGYKHLSNRRIEHQIFGAHVSRGIEPFVM